MMQTHLAAKKSTLPRQLEREVVRRISLSHAIDWPFSVGKTWIDHVGRLHPLLKTIEDWLCSVPVNKKEEHRVLEWLLCCVPGPALVAHLIGGNLQRRAAHAELLSRLETIEQAMSSREIEARWVRQPIADEVLRKHSGCGGSPLGMLAARMGRPFLALGKGLEMGIEERRAVISSALDLGLQREAILLYGEAGHQEQMNLAETIWRGMGANFSTHLLPQGDPPPLWWDRIIKQSSAGEYPHSLTALVQDRPHLAGALAAAMLRSGIREVAALSEAQPGLGMVEDWPGRDGNQLPAIGVVVDSWVAALEGKQPTPGEKSDLQKKIRMVFTRLPDHIRQQASSQNWTHIAQSIVGNGSPQVGLPSPISPQGLHAILLTEWEDRIRNASAPAWKRWAEIVSFSLGDAITQGEYDFHGYLEQMLPFARKILLDLYLTHANKEQRREAEAVLEHFLSLPYQLDWPGQGTRHGHLEWEILSLFRDRSTTTDGWSKGRELSARPNRTLRQIERLIDSHAPLTWGVEVALAMQGALSQDHEIPDWLQSFLQKEALRLGDGGGASSPPGRSRTRL